MGRLLGEGWGERLCGRLWGKAVGDGWVGRLWRERCGGKAGEGRLWRKAGREGCGGKAVGGEAVGGKTGGEGWSGKASWEGWGRKAAGTAGGEAGGGWGAHPSVRHQEAVGVLVLTGDLVVGNQAHQLGDEAHHLLVPGHISHGETAGRALSTVGNALRGTTEAVTHLPECQPSPAHILKRK